MVQITDADDADVELDIEIEWWHMCHICQEAFVTSEDLNNHNTTQDHVNKKQDYLTEKSVKTDENANITVSTKKRLRRILLSPEEKPFVCKCCSDSKRFTRRSSLKRHERTIQLDKTCPSPSNTLKCPFCERIFRKESRLLIHVQTHIPQQIIKCN